MGLDCFLWPVLNNREASISNVGSGDRQWEEQGREEEELGSIWVGRGQTFDFLTGLNAARSFGVPLNLVGHLS